MTDEKRLAWAYLSRVAEPPCRALSALVARVGAVEAADRVRRGHGGDAVAPSVEARREIDRAEKDVEVLDRLGGRLITADDDEWPLSAFTSFRGADRPRADAPMVLWAVGPPTLDEVAFRAAALVGTRAATAYGEHIAGDLAAGLVERDVAVVSGAAFGIDGAAHRSALASDGVTVAVLAGGVDVPYPAGHATLLQRIAEQGLVISEYPPGVRPARHRFLTRNRLVAALAGATVVVEAGARSGAANTAAWARSLGRSVCAVPGPVTSSASVGCHALLRAGANVVTRAEDVVELVGRVGELAPQEPRPSSPLDDLTDEDKRVYDALPRRGGRTADQIAVVSGLAPRQVLGPLANLELLGMVVCRNGRWNLALP